MVSRRIKSSVSHQSYVKVQCETRFPMIQFPAFLSMTWAFGNGRIVVPRAEMGTGIESVLCDLRVLRGKKRCRAVQPQSSQGTRSLCSDRIASAGTLNHKNASIQRMHCTEAMHPDTGQPGFHDRGLISNRRLRQPGSEVSLGQSGDRWRRTSGSRCGRRPTPPPASRGAVHAG